MLLIPGVYESDDIEHIFSLPLPDFGDQDFIMFDIDPRLLLAQCGQLKGCPDAYL